MSSKKGLLLLGVLIALICVPAAVNAADTYIEVELTDPDEYTYRGLTINTVEIVDPLDPEAIKIELLEKVNAPSKILRLPSVGEVNGAFDPAEGPYSHGGKSVYVTTSPLASSGLPEVYQDYLVYTGQTFPDFKVTGPGSAGSGNVLMVKCPENLDQNAGFTELFKDSLKEGYLFNKSGILYFKLDSEGKSGAIVGDVFYDENDLTATLEQNKVELNDFCPETSFIEAFSPGGARADFGPKPGEYIITAVKYDSSSKTMKVLAAMPVLILNKDTPVTWIEDNPYYQNLNKDVTVRFGTDIDVNEISYALVQKDTEYGLEVTVDTEELAKQPIPTSLIDAISILKNIAGKGIPAEYTLTCGGDIKDVTFNKNSHLAIVEGYGCSGYADASSVTITAATLEELNPGTYSLYAMGLNDNKVIAIDQKSVTIIAVAPTTVPTHSGGGGGGGGGASPVPPVTYTETGNLNTNTAGVVGHSVEINANDGVANLFIPAGVKALDKDGKPLTDNTIKTVADERMPQVPAGALFQFAGYTYEASPDGATFDPAITLTFDIPDELWNSLDLTSQQLTVKWYNKETGAWEDVQTTFSPETRTVRATITHFSIYALFTEPVTTVTPTETATTTATTTATPTGEAPAEGLPTTMIIFAVIIIVIIAAGVYLFVVKKD